MRDAFHESSARWPPPRCHYGTRKELISRIIDWCLGVSPDNSSHKHILWIYGPFGVGKTAIAQSCAEFLVSKGKLGASIFLSSSNRRNDPNRVFTSIAYQISIQCPSLASILEHRIEKDPSVLTASLPVQFEELLVTPLSLIAADQAGCEGWVIIVDGLDECEGMDAQRQLVQIIATSVKNPMMPFRWLITSRPEPHIVRTMHISALSSVLFSIEVPLSSETDHDILIYLVDELKVIRERFGLLPSWPSEANIAAIVELAAGLFIYAATVIRFVANDDALGPTSQLQMVLQLSKSKGRDGAGTANNPLIEMDFLYSLILARIPTPIRSTVLKILLLDQLIRYNNHGRLYQICTTLDISLEQFQIACGSLQSVLTLRESSEDIVIKFYHASFLEFITTANRSYTFCIYGETLSILRQETIQRLNIVHSLSVDGIPVANTVPSGCSTSNSSTTNGQPAYLQVVRSLAHLFEVPYAFDDSTATSLLHFRFDMVPLLLKGMDGNVWFELKPFRENLPPKFRTKLIRRSRNPVHLVQRPTYACTYRPWVLGHCDNGLVCWQVRIGPLVMWSGESQDLCKR